MGCFTTTRSDTAGGKKSMTQKKGKEENTWTET